MIVIPATAELLRRFYGDAPRRSQKAVVALDGDKVAGVAGVYVDDERLVMFSEMSDEVRANKRLMVKGIRAVLKLVERDGLPVHALADQEIEGSDKLLLHMGFTHLQDRIYEWRK